MECGMSPWRLTSISETHKLPVCLHEQRSHNLKFHIICIPPQIVPEWRPKLPKSIIAEAEQQAQSHTHNVPLMVTATSVVFIRWIYATHFRANYSTHTASPCIATSNAPFYIKYPLLLKTCCTQRESFSFFRSTHIQSIVPYNWEQDEMALERKTYKEKQRESERAPNQAHDCLGAQAYFWKNLCATHEVATARQELAAEKNATEVWKLI